MRLHLVLFFIKPGTKSKLSGQEVAVCGKYLLILQSEQGL
jgi:hypothetical protein